MIVSRPFGARNITARRADDRSEATSRREAPMIVEPPLRGVRHHDAKRRWLLLRNITARRADDRSEATSRREAPMIVSRPEGPMIVAKLRPGAKHVTNHVAKQRGS
jgi:hypothetical protein